MYKENLLNGAYPVLKDNLIPVMIDHDGTVQYATGEMGLFHVVKTTGTQEECGTSLQCERLINSWYKNAARFISDAGPWFYRGFAWNLGTGSGIFAFGLTSGAVDPYVGYRTVLSF